MKTLLEHHYVIRIEALNDDHKIDSAKLLTTCETLALEHGWQYECTRDLIELRMATRELLRA